MQLNNIKITADNIMQLIESGQLYLHESFGKISPIGKADVEILSWARGFKAQKASLSDVEFILNHPAKTVCVTEVPVNA